jgi:amidophosphoribosyltransferase
MQTLEGAFACICLVRGVGLVAFRDPNGIRPLVLGTRLTEQGPEWCVASEDCAFGPVGFKRVRDVQPGEMIIVTEAGDLVCSQCVEQRLCPCIFEYIYLARPDSVLNNISVYASASFDIFLPERASVRKWAHPPGNHHACLETDYDRTGTNFS